METSLLTLFIAIATPIFMMKFIFKGEQKTVSSFFFVGLFICLLSGIINSMVLEYGNFDKYYLTVNVTPATEELLKALPILFFAFIWNPKRQLLLECSLAVGVGFSVLENAYFMANTDDMSLWFSVIRGFGAGMMHGICTLCVGYGISFIHTKRKLFYTGSIAILTTAIIFHSIYNVIIQSAYSVVGITLPAVCFIIIIILVKGTGKKHAEN